MVSYAVVTPSRGLVHSRTVEAVMANIAEAVGHEFRGWRLSHDLPIPDCDNDVAERGLATGADALWFVEEDTIPPSGALVASIAMLEEFDVAAVDYPVGGDAWACINHDKSGAVRWCGLGSTLIHSRVFAALPRPWFTTDYVYVWRGDWAPQRLEDDPAGRYGLQDIHFSQMVRDAGFRIGQVEGMVAGHAKLLELGAPLTNHGAHQIDVATEILRYQA